MESWNTRIVELVAIIHVTFNPFFHFFYCNLIRILISSSLSVRQSFASAYRSPATTKNHLFFAKKQRFD